jgi:hypothetical protein
MKWSGSDNPGFLSRKFSVFLNKLQLFENQPIRSSVTWYRECGGRGDAVLSYSIVHIFCYVYSVYCTCSIYVPTVANKRADLCSRWNFFPFMVFSVTSKCDKHVGTVLTHSAKIFSGNFLTRPQQIRQGNFLEIKTSLR